MASINTLVDDIQRVLRTNVAVSPLSDEGLAQTALRLVGSINPRHRTTGYVRDPHVLWPREIGETCLRKVWYNLHPKGPETPPNAIDAMKFKYGHLLEEVMLTYAELAGHTVEKRQTKLTEELVSTTGDKWLIRGKIDAVIDGVLVDVKSCSRNIYNDLSTYYSQVQWYAQVGGWSEAGILAVEKASGRIRYEPVPVLPMICQTYHGDTLDELASLTPPLRPVSPGADGKMPDSCLWCPHKFRCWPYLIAYKYAFGPEFYALAPAKAPRVPVMTQAEVENEPIRG